MRTLWLVVIAVLLVFGSWSVGRAQSRLASFEINIATPRGPVRVTCTRGCDWPPNDGLVQCDTEPCGLQFTEHGRIRLGQPK